MIMNAKRPPRSWMTTYLRLATGDAKDAAPTDDPALACLLARVEKSNYRLAEAILTSQGGEKDFLQDIRTRISRGFIEEARREVRAALANLADGDAEEFRGELLFEMARIEYQSGNWAESVGYLNQAASLPDLPSITRMSVLQTRAACRYELADWPGTLADVDVVRSLQTLYPRAGTALYAEVLWIKAIARQQGTATAWPHVNELWRRFSEARIPRNADALLTLLRLTIDLRRLENQPIADLAHACHRLAEAMGDGLYAALAAVDLAYSDSLFLREQARSTLLVARARYRRIDVLLREIESAEPDCETARNILAQRIAALDPAPRRLACASESIVLLDPDFRIDLASLDIRPISFQEKSREILLALREGSMEKRDFFRKIWRVAYKRERHDIVLRNALARTRKQGGIDVASINGVVGMDKVQVAALGKRPLP